MRYIQARNAEFPPYLVDFQGSPGERHVENIKVNESDPTACSLLTPVILEDFAGSWLSGLQ